MQALPAGQHVWRADLGAALVVDPRDRLDVVFGPRSAQHAFEGPQCCRCAGAHDAHVVVHVVVGGHRLGPRCLHPVAEAVEQAGGGLGGLRAQRVGVFKGDGRAHPDAQLARVLADFGDVAGWRRPMRRHVGIAGLGAGEHIERQRGVAHREGNGPVSGAASPGLPGGGVGDPPPRRFETDQTVGAGGNADRAAAVAGMGDAHDACGNRCSCTAAGAQHGVVGVPRVARGPVEMRLGSSGALAAAELGAVRVPDADGTRFGQPASDCPGLGIAIVQLRQPAIALVAGFSLGRAEQILQRNRHASEQACRCSAGIELGGPLSRSIKGLLDDRVDRRIHLPATRDGVLNGCCSVELAGSYLLGQRSRVVHHHPGRRGATARCASPQPRCQRGSLARGSLRRPGRTAPPRT